MRASARRVLVLGLLLAAAAAQAQDSGRIQQSKEELERVRTRIEALSRTLDQSRGQRDELREALRVAETRIADAVTQMRTIERDIRDQNRKVEATRADQVQAQRALRGQRAALGQQIRSAYLIGHQARTKLLLNQQDPGKLSRVFTYFGYLNDARARRIGEIQSQVERLLQIEQRLVDETQRLNALKQTQEAALNRLEAGRAERAVAMTRLEERIKDADRELRGLRADERQLQQLIDSLRDVLADIPLDLGNSKPFGTLRGKLPWPADGRLLAGFGAPKAGGKLKWNGLWISGRAGDPVRAVAGGRVAYVGWMHRYGLIVVLEHEGGYFTLYGHNQTATKTAGEWVRAGEPIATVGDSGGHTQMGVYFELRKGAAAVNPRDWLARR